MSKKILFCLIGAFFFCKLVPQSSPDARPTRLLIKIPTRSRPTQFFATLDQYYKLLSGKTDTRFLISCDQDDVLMNCQLVRDRLATYKNLYFYFGSGNTKISAYNRDIEKHSDFDILVVTSDDLLPQISGYDEVIVSEMKKSFPDMDGVLAFSDGNSGGLLCPYPIMGKKYYDRFGYIYHPHYKSLFCDNELTEIAHILNRIKFIDTVLFEHHHPLLLKRGATHVEMDSLYVRNESLDPVDRATYQYRRAGGYNLHPFTKHVVKMSILIPTLESRKKLFNELYAAVAYQINEAGFKGLVEIVVESDDGKLSVGMKRNRLLMRSLGEYVCFLDDDDAVSPDYVKMLYQSIATYPDCVELRGIITFDGLNPKEFIHSLKYKEYFEKDGIYYRPPNHLNVVRRDVAIRFQFPLKYFGEDSDWTMQMCRSGLLQREVTVPHPYYFYRYSAKNSATANKH